MLHAPSACAEVAATATSSRKAGRLGRRRRKAGHRKRLAQRTAGEGAAGAGVGPHWVAPTSRPEEGQGGGRGISGVGKGGMAGAACLHVVCRVGSSIWYSRAVEGSTR